MMVALVLLALALMAVGVVALAVIQAMAVLVVEPMAVLVAELFRWAVLVEMAEPTLTSQGVTVLLLVAAVVVAAEMPQMEEMVLTVV